jgi:tetratricopeptide (TPR) repeat protein
MILAHPVRLRLITRLLSVCFLCTVFTQLNAQTQEIKDSIFSALKNSRTDIDRIKTLNALSYEHYDFDDSIGFHYAQQALTLAKKTDYPFGLQYAYTMVGVGYFSFGEYTKALENFRSSGAIPPQVENQDHYLYNMMLTANVLADIGQYDSAHQILKEGLTLAIRFKNVKREASMRKSQARIQIRLWQNEDALRNLKYADSIRNAQNDYERADFAYLYSKIYLNQSDLKNATLQIDVLCTMTKDIDDYLHKSLCHLMQSALDQLNGQYPTALSHAFQALEITKIYNYPYLRAQIYLQIGLLYSDLSEFDIASEFFFRVLKITEEKGIDPLSAQAYANLGLIFKDQKNYLLSLKYVDQAEKLFRKWRTKEELETPIIIEGLSINCKKNMMNP